MAPFLVRTTSPPWPPFCCSSPDIDKFLYGVANEAKDRILGVEAGGMKGYGIILDKKSGLYIFGVGNLEALTNPTSVPPGQKPSTGGVGVGVEIRGPRRKQR